jgi:hypothetical protein
MYRGPGSLEDLPSLSVVRRQRRDSNGRRDVCRRQWVGPNDKRRGRDDRPQSLRFAHRNITVGAVEHDGELIAAVANDQIARACVLCQQSRHLDENLVAAGEQVLAVDLAKVVEINGEKRQRVAEATGALAIFDKTLTEHVAPWQAGHWIDCRRLHGDRTSMRDRNARMDPFRTVSQAV